MKQELIDNKIEELQRMLVRAHKMLTDIGIPVAPLEDITITVNPSTSKVIPAECIWENGKFTISLHAYSVYEPEIDGEKKETFNAVMHELVHTCKYNGEYGLWQHQGKYSAYAKKIADAYNINIKTSITPIDFKYVTKEPLHVIKCAHCDYTYMFYSEKAFEKDRKKYAGRKTICPYCGKYNTEDSEPSAI